MKIFSIFLLGILLTAKVGIISAQQIKFNRVSKNGFIDSYTDMVQDKQGYIWTVGFQAGGNLAVLSKYDGAGFTTFKPDVQNPNAIQNYIPFCLAVDNNNKIWIGFMGGGADRFDPITGIFTHYHHNKKDVNSISNDTVTCILADNTGNIWLGTQNGLNLMNIETGKFTHYFHRANDSKSISSNNISALYRDHTGLLWVGCDGNVYSPDPLQQKAGTGLNLYHSSTGTFTNFRPNPNHSSVALNNKISCIYEDKKGAFWVGTQMDGLYTLDRKTGIFTYYPYDPAHPEKLSSLPIGKEINYTKIFFIHEDIKGGLWIGTGLNGLVRYDPDTKKITQYGIVIRDGHDIYKDTSGGVVQWYFTKGISSPDGMFWITSLPPGVIYNISFIKNTIPFVPMDANANAFYQEPDGKVLWVGTNKGLFRKDLVNKTQEMWSKASPNKSGWAHDTIGNMCRDKNGIFWIATLGGGLCRFDPVTNKAVYYMHNKKDLYSISSNLARNLLIDHNNNVWVGTWGQGVDMLDTKSQHFIHYEHHKDSSSLSNNVVDCIFEDKDKNIWAATFDGLNKLNKDGKTFERYLNKKQTLTITTDNNGIMWVGGSGLDYYDKAHDKFLPFVDSAIQGPLFGVVDIQADEKNNLWLRTTTAIVKINSKRNEAQFYGDAWGVNANNVWINRSLKGKNGEIFFGTLGGYYDFFPDEIKPAPPPRINLTGFELAGLSDKKQPLIDFSTKTLELSHNQNTFSLDFIALHYDSPGEEKYSTELENYDRIWRDLGTEHKVSFFEIPPGKYTLRIKAFNPDGGWNEKDLVIIINPPWWNTWWAYLIFGIAAISAIWGLIEFRSRQLIAENKLLEEKINQRTIALQQSMEELKATQKQLIQSEKMASLGELTAGIAHEIQNPLNFVNNFCEVNSELIDEMKEEIANGNLEEANFIADDIKENQQKINHHGKRADAIVKGMLQHSRTSTGQKEPTDINALADEYLRLSYHGLRAKDKSFNADMKVNLDDNIGKINLVPQDVGRVMLNLFNNAFYAVSEKKKQLGEGYAPTVFLSTKKIGNTVEVKIRDNGNGIPQNVIDKMFQPFFTTKPTGEGTGLGLSISYDIIKSYGGSLKAETKEGEFAEFTIILPV
jgi:signal transduction histidine kinase/ligand-binding sensor domain-containing protein